GLLVDRLLGDGVLHDLLRGGGIGVLGRDRGLLDDVVVLHRGSGGRGGGLQLRDAVVGLLQLLGQPAVLVDELLEARHDVVVEEVVHLVHVIALGEPNRGEPLVHQVIWHQSHGSPSRHSRVELRVARYRTAYPMNRGVPTPVDLRVPGPTGSPAAPIPAAAGSSGSGPRPRHPAGSAGCGGAVPSPGGRSACRRPRTAPAPARSDGTPGRRPESTPGPAGCSERSCTRGPLGTAALR